MKKRLSAIVALIISAAMLIFFSGCQNSGNSDAPTDAAESSTAAPTTETRNLVFTLTTDTDNPHTSTDAAFIDEVIKYIDDAEKTEEEYVDANGWKIFIRIYSGDEDGTMIYLLGDTLKIDDKQYSVNDDFESGLMSLYDRMG